MPYKSEYTHKQIPISLDRRVKLTDEDKNTIKELYTSKLYSNQTIWNMFWIHRSTVYLLCNPDIMEKHKKQYKERRKDGRYYNKEQQRVTVKNTRKYRVTIEDKLVNNKYKTK